MAPTPPPPTGDPPPTAPTVPGPVSPVQGPVVAGAPAEPVLDVHEIQGNVLVGFNKDHQAFLFFQITDPGVARQWLRAIAPRIATVAETLAFRRLHRALRHRRTSEAAGLVATWVNIAFTFHGLQQLAPPGDADQFASDAFRLGMAERARQLGDPADPQGQPTGWVVGAADRVPDLLLIVASDDRDAMRSEVERIKDEVESLQGAPVSGDGPTGLRLIHEDEGADLPGDLAGHEHFGFKDGISQPGIRGRVSDAPADFLTPRLIDPADPLARTHARPGQPLIWPGQFVLGAKYPVQDPFDALNPQPQDEPTPAWAANGSFLVLRRLRQDVASFWRFMHDTSAELARKFPDRLGGLTAERLASLIVGRWPSGTPVMRAPLADDPGIAANRTAVNNFQFKDATAPVRLIPGSSAPNDDFAPSPADDQGSRCPFAAHLRKVNPRDDTTELGGPERTLPKRLLRRGIPFGKPLKNPLRPGRDQGRRGLMFVSYQASIEEQFEFLTTDWTNSTKNPRSFGDDQPAGHDPLIGQQTDGGRSRRFTLRVDDRTFEPIELPRDWVIPTGGGYFFAPSISALRDVLGRTPAPA